MRVLFVGAAILAVGIICVAAQDSRSAPSIPSFTSDGHLLLPADYREWIFLSSGLGMTYGPLRAGADEAPPFENVFVLPSAYRSFLKIGAWPEHTMFILEVRNSGKDVSINKDGHVQTGIRGIEAEVKDSARFATKWAFFDIDPQKKTGTLFPPNATCYACHGANGAVDNTFVQFYPTLIDIARAHGTFHQKRENRE